MFDDRSQRRGRLAIAASFLVAVLEGYDIQAFGVAAPSLAPALGLTAGQQGLAASAAMVGLALGAMVGGWLADRVGRRPVLTAAVIVFGVCSLWTGMVGSYGMLLAARAVTGVGFGAALPNLIAIAAEVSHPSRRGATTSAMFCGVPAGGACVALAANVLGDALDWRTIFLVGGLLPLVIAPLVFFLLPETRPAGCDEPPPRVAAALFGQGRAWRTVLLWTANLLTLLVLYLLLNWLSTLLVAKGRTQADGAAAAMAFNLAGIAGALLLGFVVDRFGPRWTMASAYLALALVLTALSQTGALVALLFLSGAAGFLVLGVQYSLYGLAPQIYPASARGVGAGAAVGIGRVGAIVGPLLAGQLRGAGWSAEQVLLALLPVALLAGGAAVAFTGQMARAADGGHLPTSLAPSVDDRS